MGQFMELYQSVYKDLYRFAYYYLGNTQDAEDAVQDAALLAYENFQKLKKTESFRPWIFKILVNCCKRHLRRRIKAERRKEAGEASYEPSLSQGEELRELLSGLSREERLIVSLAVFGGYKGEEIARILHRKPATVRSKYRRALKKLEVSLMREGEMAE